MNQTAHRTAARPRRRQQPAAVTVWPPARVANAMAAAAWPHDPIATAAGGIQPAGRVRVRVLANDAVRRHGLMAMLRNAGHTVVEDPNDVLVPDVVVYDSDLTPEETEAPAVVLVAQHRVPPPAAGILPVDASPEQLDLAVRCVAAGLLVRAPTLPAEPGFASAAEDIPLLTPREREILTLVGQGMSNKAIARQLRISVHTVKFHLEALFLKLNAASRAEAVAKGLVGGVIEL